MPIPLLIRISRWRYLPSRSISFLAPSSQKVVNDIYSGRVIFSTAAHRSVLADNYKPRAIEVYDCRKAPFLDHYRYDACSACPSFAAHTSMHAGLRVPTLWDYPRVSQFCCSFVFLYPLPYLFVKCPLFFRCCTNRYADQDLDVVTGWEIVFGVCAAAFVLEEYTAATEHGWSHLYCQCQYLFELTHHRSLCYLPCRHGTRSIFLSSLSFSCISA